MTITPPIRPGPPGFGPALHCAGAVLVGVSVVLNLHGASAPVLAIGFAALLAWVVRALSRRVVVADVAAVVMVVAGSAVVPPTDALLIAPVIVGVAGVTADIRHRVASGPLLGAVGFTIAVLGGLSADRAPSFFLGVFGGYALGVAVGLSRRRGAVADARERELEVRAVALERVQQRAELLTERATVARDIHDVLAHSLGGLVIQLDAAEALLESGRTAEALSRVTAARTLAAEGLDEARRAVATLRDPRTSPVEGADARDFLGTRDAVDRLIEAHRELGGTITATGTALLERLDDRQRRAVAGVLREALSNARRHAPGREVTVTFSAPASRRILRVAVVNAVDGGVDGGVDDAVDDGVDDARDRGPSGGAGLPGMRSRVDELDDGATLVAGRHDGRFRIDAELPLGPGR